MPRPAGPVITSSNLRFAPGVEASVEHQWVATTKPEAQLIVSQGVEAIVAKRAWQGPAGIAVGLVAALVTGEFQPAFGLSASDWRAIFVVGSIVAIVFTVYFLRYVFNKASAETIVQALVDCMTAKETQVGGRAHDAARRWNPTRAALIRQEHKEPRRSGPE